MQNDDDKIIDLPTEGPGVEVTLPEENITPEIEIPEIKPEGEVEIKESVEQVEKPAELISEEKTNFSPSLK